MRPEESKESGQATSPSTTTRALRILSWLPALAFVAVLLPAFEYAGMSLRMPCSLSVGPFRIETRLWLLLLVRVFIALVVTFAVRILAQAIARRLTRSQASNAK